MCTAGNSLFLCSNSFYSLSIFLSSHPVLGIPVNRKRKQRGENETEEEIITVHELPVTETVNFNSVTIRLTSGFL